MRTMRFIHILLYLSCSKRNRIFHCVVIMHAFWGLCELFVLLQRIEQGDFDCVFGLCTSVCGMETDIVT